AAAASPRTDAMPKHQPPASSPARADSGIAMPRFDALLDLLPEETQEFVIVTDAEHLLRVSEAVRTPLQAQSKRFWSRFPGNDEHLFQRWGALEGVLASSELEAQRGLLLVKAGGK